MSETQVNGEKPTSLTVNHITSYPLPADLINIYESHPLGQRSIALIQHIYSSISPYLATPISVLAPYLERADHIGNKTLSSLDERFPAIKETDLGTLRSHAEPYVRYPFGYVVETYQDEYKKLGAETQFAHTAKAIVSTELRIMAESVRAFANWVGPKTKEAEQKYSALVGQAGSELEKLKSFGIEKIKQTQKIAQDKSQEAQQVGEEKKEEVVNGQ